MKHWQETGQIVDRVVRLGQEGRRCALATVTRIEGSAYRRPGAKLLIEDDGAVHGGVSGGCLEEDVRQVGLRVLRGEGSRLLHYATGDDENKVWGLGLGCEGQVDVLVQPVSLEEARAPWARVQDLLQGDLPFTLSSLLETDGTGGVLVGDASGRIAGSLGDGEADAAIEAAARAALRAGRSGWSALGAGSVFTEVLLPPPKLLVCGAGDDARPLVAFAAAAGFRVLVADHRSAYLTVQRFPDARRLVSLRPKEASNELPEDGDNFVVVMTHSLERDAQWVRRFLETKAPYVGVLGPRARTDKILEGLGAAGSPRVFGPVGLDLGADGPEQVAVSIVAELLSVWSGRELRHLRERESAVHALR